MKVCILLWCDLFYCTASLCLALYLNFIFLLFLEFLFQEWKVKIVSEQDSLKLSETPKLTIKLISEKMALLDREVNISLILRHTRYYCSVNTFRL